MFEYKVVPAPAKGVKAKGLKGAEARFAFAVEQVMNELGAEGWEYQRTDVLPSEERQGLTGSVTNWRNLMVFRRALETGDAARDEDVPARVEPVLSATPAVTSAVPEGDGIADVAAADSEAKDGAEATRPA